MRVLIMSDMEGVSGIVDWPQVNGGAPMYEEGRRLYTEEINAAVRGHPQAGTRRAARARSWWWTATARAAAGSSTRWSRSCWTRAATGSRTTPAHASHFPPLPTCPPCFQAPGAAHNLRGFNRKSRRGRRNPRGS